MNLKLSALLGLLLTFAACNGTPTTGNVTTPTPQTSTPAATPSVISAFAGTWRSAAAAAGACTSTAWTITPTSDTTATIVYTATCAGVPVTGSAAGTLNGTTMNWTSSGNGGGCAFALSGTSVPTASTDLAITYTGTVCGAPVSGTDTLRR